MSNFLFSKIRSPCFGVLAALHSHLVVRQTALRLAVFRRTGIMGGLETAHRVMAEIRLANFVWCSIVDRGPEQRLVESWSRDSGRDFIMSRRDLESIAETQRKLRTKEARFQGSSDTLSSAKHQSTSFLYSLSRTESLLCAKSGVLNSSHQSEIE